MLYVCGHIRNSHYRDVRIRFLLFWPEEAVAWKACPCFSTTYNIRIRWFSRLCTSILLRIYFCISKQMYAFQLFLPLPVFCEKTESVLQDFICQAKLCIFTFKLAYFGVSFVFCQNHSMLFLHTYEPFSNPQACSIVILIAVLPSWLRFHRIALTLPL